jgi:hypothetical protein
VSEYGVNGQHRLADLQPSEAELAELADVMAEIEAEEALPDDYGPWDDSADLSNVYDYSGAFAAVDAAGEAEAQRLAEDVEAALERRPSFQTRMDRALDRIGRGTYTTPAYYREPEPSYGCGQGYDDFGRCAARFHQASCLETARGEAATGSARAVEAWNHTLLANQEAAPIDLAAPALDTSWEDLLGPDGGPGAPADLETLNAMREMLGISSRELPNPARFGQGAM